jgi:hypothetical protein
VGEPSMPEERKFLQPAALKSITTLTGEVPCLNPILRSRLRRVTIFRRDGSLGYTLIAGIPTLAATPHDVFTTVIIVAVIGLIHIISRLLLNYAEIIHAWSIATIRRKAIKGKIAPKDAVDLIQADILLPNSNGKELHHRPGKASTSAHKNTS